jgi:hypothetical protein
MPMHALEALAEQPAEPDQTTEALKYCDAVANTAKQATAAAERCADIVDELLSR